MRNKHFRRSFIPNKPRIYRTLRKVKKLNKITDISELPVDPFAIFKKLDIPLYSCGQALKIYGSKDPFGLIKNNIDAKTFYGRERQIFITIYNETFIPERIRWTIAHEIGHIFLGHHTDFEQTEISKGLSFEEYDVLEREANVFAAELLAPMNVLLELGLSSPFHIRNVADISIEAALNRTKDIFWWSKKPIYQKLKKHDISQFNTFISQYRKDKNIINYQYIDVPF